MSSQTTIQKLMEKMKLLRQASGVNNETCARRSIATENTATVAQSNEEKPGLSTSRRFLELSFPQMS